jgi:hypothetical protein
VIDDLLAKTTTTRLPLQSLLQQAQDRIGTIVT